MPASLRGEGPATLSSMPPLKKYMNSAEDVWLSNHKGRLVEGGLFSCWINENEPIKQWEGVLSTPQPRLTTGQGKV